MLVSLRIKNAFRHPNTVIEFQKGYTSVTGPNESGKSMIFEMISYALFGTVALRGKAEDYKKLEVYLQFEVSGKPYAIERVQGKCNLSDKTGLICTGVKEVNRKIIEILGYDYDVFCTANYCTQGQVTRLSDMKPAERKKMVDNLIGLNIIDDLHNVITSKMQRHKGMIEGEGLLGEYPVAPTAPAGWGTCTTEQLELARTAAITVKVQRESLQKVIQENQSSIPPAEMNLMHDGEIPEWVTLPNLMAHTNLRHFTEQLASIMTEAASLSSPYTWDQLSGMEEQWKGHTKWVDAQTKLANRSSDVSKFTDEDLNLIAQEVTNHETYLRELHDYNHAPSVDCPECHHQFKVGREAPIPVKEPQLSKQQVQEERVLNAKLAMESKMLAEYEQVPEVAKPELSLSEIATHRGVLSKIADLQTRQQGIIERMQDLKPEGDASTIEYLYKCKDHDDKERTRYLNELQSYNEKLERARKAEQELSELPSTGGDIDALTTLIREFTIYDQVLQNYNNSIVLWEQKRDRLTDLTHKLDQYELARTSLRTLRAKVKKYLVPSLNKVASLLLAQMTGGERTLIEVSEDFDILVDGQPINTLSGSGKAVANLAIRIGLGQVLINKKFSVFMGDEIDGDMDADRAAYTSECLERLTKNIGQLLLISHKKPVAQHYIEL